MLDSLRSLIERVSNAENVDEALSIVVRWVKTALAVDACTIYLLDAATREFVLMATDGLNPAVVGRIRLRGDQGIVGLVGERRTPVLLDAAADHPRFYFVPETGEERYRSLLAVPVIHYRELLGVLLLQHRDCRVFDAQQEAFLVTIAAQIAGAVNSAVLAERGATPGAGSPFVQGLACTPGVAIGTIVVTAPFGDLDAVPDRAALEPEAEEAFFRKAVREVEKELNASSARMAQLLPGDLRSLFETYAMITTDKDFIDGIVRRIRGGQWAAAALRDVIVAAAGALARSDDERLRARAQDIRAVGHQILIRLQTDRCEASELPARTILLGDEISIATIADVPREKLVGVIASRGSLLSHTAIVCRSLGVPSVFGVGDGMPLARFDGAKAIIDGYSGRVFINPAPELLREYRLLEQEERELNASLAVSQGLPALTKDELEIPLHVNLGLRTDVARALEMGISGVGLYRTELPFMLRDTFPAENEQVEIYRAILEAFAPRPTVMRTLDIGADKSLPYFPIEEDNPALGLRGVRLSLNHPEIFLSQLKAMLRANADLGTLRILVPMISTPAEIAETRALLDDARRILEEEAMAFTVPPVGVMIEVPAAIYQIGQLARYVDFFSIGTNDLTQYLLAVDRANARVAGLYDYFNPAVIRAVAEAVQRSHAHDKPVTICGEMAGDPAGAILLTGMAVDGLSMSVASVPRVKHVIRSFSSDQARALLAAALDAEGPAEVRKLLHDALEEAGLGRLIRAGR